ncbi:MAG: hypothetical protein OXG92_07455 [Chloroflexi bacterium]|nr:hypothetical protein [Chloroflexota bacterium]MCY3581739.1 hypothetical protein [Chloroflexota bacterium]MCY3716287.1 hypothetical protein [Chloroflexota bacterium]MDE2650212.1 hypothetical protein [Chloroflexota bacterium]MXV93529.1 hypothetical protein [Chloroflexota bacterium]
MKRTRPKLDDGAAFAGILLGILLGGIYAQLRINRRGAVRRRDLLEFGGASGELEMEATLQAAKRQARERQAAEN